MPKKSEHSDSSDLETDAGNFEYAFPVRITAKQLPRLNESLGDFAQSLQYALSIYKKGGHSGRDGASACLITINLFLSMFEIIDKDNLMIPLNVLISALNSLNDNNQLPILTPVPSTGRAKSSYMRSILEGWAVVTVERIMAMGIPLDEACQKVASFLDKAGVKPTRGNTSISARTVRNWKQRAAEDVAMIDVMAQARKVYSDFIKSNEDSDEASIDDALENLGVFLELARSSDLR